MATKAQRALLSGEARGLGPTALRVLLLLISLPNLLVVKLRLMAYRLGLLRRHGVGVPVVCVGNLTTGGTGKSPMVALVAQVLIGKGHKVGLLSRGYRAEAGGLNDEARMLAEQLPGVPHVQNPDRVAGARELQRMGVTVIVMDDGFSHLRLKRDLDILLFDATAPFGYGHLLPRGLLREPVSSAGRAGFAVITRSDSVSEGELSELEQKLERLGLASAKLARSKHQPVALLRLGDGAERGVEWLANRRVVALCGIANPEAFATTLRAAGAEVVELVGLEDHFGFGQAWIDLKWGELIDRAVAAGAEAVVVTQKDAVKLRERNLPDRGPEVLELRIGLQLEADGLERLNQEIEQVAHV